MNTPILYPIRSRVSLSIRTAVLCCFVLLPLASIQAQIGVTTLTEPFSASGDISVGPDGNIYVGNFGPFLNNGTGAQVYRVTPDGEFSVFATGLNGASGNTFDEAGNLYQSNIAGGVVSRITPDGTVTTFSTGHSGPVGVAIDSTGQLFVANCGNNTIRRATANGASQQFSVSPMYNCPNGLTVDQNDVLYMANFSNGSVFRIAGDGTPTRIGNIPGNNNGHLIHRDGVLYVVGRGGNRIWTLPVDNQLPTPPTLLAGTGARGNQDGPAESALFNLPNGIDFSADGRVLYVNDATSLTGTPGTAPLTPVVLRAIELFPENTFEITSRISGSWFDETHDGEGFVIQILEAGRALVYWFTYDGEGNQRWFVGVAVIEGPRIVVDTLIETSGPSFGEAFDPDDVVSQVAGSLIIEVFACDQAVAGYVVDGVSGSQMLGRITQLAGNTCDVDAKLIGAGHSGSWYDLTHDGEGFVVEVLPDGRVLLYWFSYNDEGAQAWMMGAGMLDDAGFSLELVQPVGGRFGDDFDPADVEALPWGTVLFELNCEMGQMSYESDIATFGGGAQSLIRLTRLLGLECSDT